MPCQAHPRHLSRECKANGTQILIEDRLRRETEKMSVRVQCRSSSWFLQHFSLWLVGPTVEQRAKLTHICYIKQKQVPPEHRGGGSTRCCLLINCPGLWPIQASEPRWPVTTHRPGLESPSRGCSVPSSPSALPGSRTLADHENCFAIWSDLISLLFFLPPRAREAGWVVQRQLSWRISRGGRLCSF